MHAFTYVLLWALSGAWGGGESSGGLTGGSARDNLLTTVDGGLWLGSGAAWEGLVNDGFFLISGEKKQQLSTLMAQLNDTEYIHVYTYVKYTYAQVPGICGLYFGTGGGGPMPPPGGLGGGRRLSPSSILRGTS